MKRLCWLIRDAVITVIRKYYFLLISRVERYFKILYFFRTQHLVSSIQSSKRKKLDIFHSQLKMRLVLISSINAERFCTSNF